MQATRVTFLSNGTANFSECSPSFFYVIMWLSYIRFGYLPRLMFVVSFTDATEGTEFNTLEFTMKVKCTLNKSQPKDSYRAEDLYENHSGMSLLNSNNN